MSRLAIDFSRRILFHEVVVVVVIAFVVVKIIFALYSLCVVCPLLLV
jgi:hypothetical protein